MEEKFLISRRNFLKQGAIFVGASSISSILNFSCGNKKTNNNTNRNKTSQVIPRNRQLQTMDNILSFVDNIHMADIDHQGLFIDFGTASRFKYTLGNWMSGWGNDREENGVTFTEIDKSPARFYFHLDSVSPLQIGLRAKTHGPDRLSLMLNDEMVGSTRINSDWDFYTITIPAEKTRAGENQLKFVLRGDNSPLISLDYLRISPSDNPLVTGNDFFPPTLDSFRSDVNLGDENKKSLILYTPTNISFYFLVPTNAKLGFCAAINEENRRSNENVTIKAKIKEDNAEENQILSQQIQGTNQWNDFVVDLNSYAGKIVRLTLSVESQVQSKIAICDAGIYCQPQRINLTSNRAKNVIVLLIDTLRADHLNIYSNTNVQSPAIVNFANEGAIFEKCQSPSNWTKPATASLLTGLYPDTHLARGDNTRISNSTSLLSQIIKGSGENFSTAAFIANGYLAGEFGFNVGWDKYINYIRESKPTEAEYVFGDAIAWIEEHKNDRFFTYIHTIDPHVPYSPPDADLQLYDNQPYNGVVRPRSTGELLEDYKKGRVTLNERDKARLHALYKGEISYHDHHFERFIQRLRELNLLDDTFIVITADHGEEFFEHNSVGHGHSLHQELLHVPLIMRKPGIIAQSTRISDIVSLVDVVPTVLEAIGINVSNRNETQPIEGKSLFSKLQGARGNFWNSGFSSWYSEPDTRNLSWAIRTGDWKLRFHGPANINLYNLRDDATEQQNIVEQNPITLRTTQIILSQFIGAPDKSKWDTDNMEEPSLQRQEERVEIDEQHRAQLRAMGYIH